MTATITKKEVEALGGDTRGALFAVFYPDGSLYFTTSHKRAGDDTFTTGDGRACEIKEIIDDDN